MAVRTVILFLMLLAFYEQSSLANEAARRLFDDLLSNYNKLVRPVKNHSDTLQVQIRLRLSQLLDVHEKEQIMKTNVWLKQEWHDHKLTWNPEEYDGIDMLYIPASVLWTPDIVLYNTAGGNYEITIKTKAQVYSTGWVVSSLDIVQHKLPLECMQCKVYIVPSAKLISIFFQPNQNENLVQFPDLGTTSSLSFHVRNECHVVDLIHYKDKDAVKEFVNEYGQQVWRVEDGIDLNGYHPHVEWEILEVPGERHFIRYPCCEAPFVDVTYYLIIRRKTLFYTVNLIIPCIGISCLTVFVFYLPADSGEKIVMCISILISLNALFLLLVEIIPPTSIVMPLIVRYLLFTMVLVTLSVAVTVVTLSIHYRSPSTHRMPWIIKHIFLERLPPLLGIRKPLWAIRAIETEGDLFRDTKIRRTIKKRSKSGRQRRRTSPIDSKSENNTSVVVANCRDRNCVASNVSVQLPKVVVNWPASGTEQTDSENDKPVRRSRMISDHGIRKSKTTDTFMHPNEESRLIVDAWGEWGEWASVYSLMRDREESRKILFQTGDKLSAIRFVATSVALIAHKIRREAKEKEIIESWSFVGMVIDRLFLIIFSIVCLAGTCCIILQAPSLYDTRKPIGEMNLV